MSNKRIKNQTLSKQYVGFLYDLHLDFLLPEQLKEDSQNAGEFFAINSLVSVDVEKVEDVLYIIGWRTVSSNQSNERVQHLRKLVLREPFILVFIELAKNFVEEERDVLVSEFSGLIRFGQLECLWRPSWCSH